MKIKKIDREFSVCKVADYSLVDWNAEYFFIGKTEEERSLVCLTNEVPRNFTMREDGWKAFRIQETLDFSLIGILSGISEVLAKNKIGIFVISTFNTDYVLTKKEDYKRALELLEIIGYQIID